MDWARRWLATRPAIHLLLALVVVLILAGSAAAAGFSMFDSPGVGDKPQSKLWHHDGAWWGCFNNSSKLSIYKHNGTGWTKKLDVANAIVPFDKGGTNDVVWDGTHLFVVAWNATTSKVYKLAYNAGTDNFSMVSGFPINIGMQPGSETITMDKDSTGRLWLTYEGSNQIWVHYSTSADHKSWSFPLAIGANVDRDDISAVVAFGGNKIGVVWSDQVAWRTVMRVHRDTDPPNVWQSIETILTGWGTTDDHVSLKADDTGRVFLVVKDYFDTIWVARREAAGGWTLAPGANGVDCGTRPIIQLEPFSNRVYIFYTRWTQCANIGVNNIEVRVADPNVLNFSLPVVIMSASSQSMNDVAASKQMFPAGAGLIVCEGGTKVYWNGWGAVSGIGGTPPPANYPSAPAPPAGIAAQSISETPTSRALLCRFDETAGVVASDASGNGRHMTFGPGDNAPHWYPGLTNGGLFFDGNDYIRTNGAPFNFAGNSFTLETWLKLDLTSSQGTGAIFSRSDSVHTGYKLSLSGGTVDFAWSVDDTLDVGVKANGPFLDGAWHHVAAVWDAARSEGRLYIDGSHAATKILPPPTYPGNWELTMGALVQGIYINEEFEGILDMAAIASGPLYSNDFTPRILYPATTTRYLKLQWYASTSAAGIAGYRLTRSVNGGTPALIGGLVAAQWYASIMPPDGFLTYAVSAVDGLMQEGLPSTIEVAWENTPPAVPSAPLGLSWTAGTASLDGPAFWEMDEGTGSELPDGTGLGHSGRLGDPPAGDSAEPTWITAYSGKGLRFDGNDYVEIADAPDLRFNGVSMTIEAWVRRGQLGSTQAILNKDSGSSTRNYGLAFLSDGKIEFSWARTSGSTRKITTSTTITDTEWHHIACTYNDNGGVSTIFLDGEVAAQASHSGSMYTGNEPVLLGARSPGSLGNFFRGDLDLVRISSGLRYTGPFTPPDVYRGGPRRPTIVLNWGLPAAGLVEEYRLYRRLLPSGSDSQIATLDVTAPRFTDVQVEQNKTYRYTVRAVNSTNSQGPASAPLDVPVPSATDVQSDQPPMARGPRLRIEPNPFNPQALVRFRLDAAGPVRVELYDVRGRKVDTLFQGMLAAGEHTARMVRPERSTSLSSGIYFVRLIADGQETRVKAVLIK